MNHLYYWGAAVFIAALIGFYGCYRQPPSTIVRKIQRGFGVNAMCYEVSRPTSVSFVCPVCGTRTIYPIGSCGHIILTADRLEAELRFMSRQGQTPSYTIEFDKTQFCDKCTPGRTGPPRLILIVRHEGVEDPHRVEGVTEDDLMLILYHVQGRSERRDATTGNTQPMKHFHKRLNDLLGLSLEVDEKKGKTSDD